MSDEVKVEKVTSGTVTKREPGAAAKVFGLFFNQDINIVKDELIKNVVVPKVLDTVYTILNSGLELFLYGDIRNRNRPSTQASGSTMRINYGGFSQPVQANRTVQKGPTGSNRIDFESIIFENVADAEDVKDGLLELIDVYGQATVANFCELAGIPDEYTDQKIGWTSLGTAETKPIRGGGYYLKLPRPILLPK